MAAYTFKTALSGLWREKWINLLSALTIASGLFIMTLTLIFFHNVDMATKRLPDNFAVAAFLDDGLPQAEIGKIVDAVKANASVREVKYISKEDALHELKALMKDSDYILDGLDANPLPASLEIRLKRESVSGDSVETLASALTKMKGVSDVQYGRKFLSVLQSLKRSSETVGALFIGILSAGMAFVCYSTVKILFYRKKDEMETLKFLGATRGFIRAPFVIEGGFIGLSGGLACSAGTLALQYLVFDRLIAYVPIARALSIPGELALYAPLAGLLIGMSGALIATGRIRF